MSFTFLAFLSVAAVVMAISAIVTVVAVRRAPVGIETAKGFQSLGEPESSSSGHRDEAAEASLGFGLTE